MTLTASNPFTSARIRPGEIDYIFASGQCVDRLVERLAHNRWRGQIVGPHGTGKSTLVQSLVRRLQAAGCEVTLGAFQGGRERWTTLPPAADESAGPARRIVVIDGFEQLSAPARAMWKLRCRLSGRGLIVTAHQSVGLPELWRTSVSPLLAQEIVARIAGEFAPRISASEIDGTLQASGGNMRDALFMLYDTMERR